MKEYFLVPTHEIEEMKKILETKQNPLKTVNETPEKNVFENKSISKEDMIELHNQINWLRRLNESVDKTKIDEKHDVLQLQNEIDRLRRLNESVDKTKIHEKNNVNSGVNELNDITSMIKVSNRDIKKSFNLRNKHIIEDNIPKSYVDEAYELLKRLHEKNVIELDNYDNIVNVANNKKITLKDFLRGVFIKEAKVSHISDFLKDVIIKIDQRYIRNRKALELLIGKTDKIADENMINYNNDDDILNYVRGSGRLNDY